jgi:hypothetical protein
MSDAFKAIQNRQPIKLTEEGGLVSVFLKMSEINDNWLRVYISPPGGAWQKILLHKDEKIIPCYIHKQTKRPDLCLLKKATNLVFFVAEAKQSFADIQKMRDEIARCMKDFYDNVVKQYLGGDNKLAEPFYSFIVVVNPSKQKDYPLDKELKRIENSTNELEGQGLFETGVACIVVFEDLETQRTRFKIFFSNRCSSEKRALFETLFEQPVG